MMIFFVQMMIMTTAGGDDDDDEIKDEAKSCPVFLSIAPMYHLYLMYNVLFLTLTW